MSIYILIFLSLIILTWLMNIKTIKIIFLKKLIFPLSCLVFILCLIIFSKTAVNSAVKGINLWLFVVFPSLFPFFIACELLNKTGIIKALGVLLEPIMRPLFNIPGCGSFAFVMGITSGYPVGAKITSSMREENLLTKTEAERLLAFTNNSGPLFIIGAVAVGMYKIPELGIFLLSCHILSCITVGLLFRFYGENNHKYSNSYTENIMKRFTKELSLVKRVSLKDLGNYLGDAVNSSLSVILSIGGFIVFFSVIINILLETGFIGFISEVFSIILEPLNINKNLIESIIIGFFEITSGTNAVSILSNASLVQKLTATSLIIGWAGLSVHSQVMSIVIKTDISIKPYFFGKFLQGVLSAIYTYIGIKIIDNSFLNSKPVFSYAYNFNSQNWHDYFFYSFKSFSLSLGILAIGMFLSIIINVLSRKKHNRP